MRQAGGETPWSVFGHSSEQARVTIHRKQHIPLSPQTARCHTSGLKAFPNGSFFNSGQSAPPAPDSSTYLAFLKEAEP